MPFSFCENCCHTILYPVGVFHDMCCTHSVLLLYAYGATLCVPYSTLPYSLLLGCSHALLYVCLTLHYPILDCGHTLSLCRCGDCLICVFLILYLYNVVSGDCGPHFVFTPRILHVTWVSKSLLTLPLLDIISTLLYTIYPPYRYFRHIPKFNYFLLMLQMVLEKADVIECCIGAKWTHCAAVNGGKKNVDQPVILSASTHYR